MNACIPARIDAYFHGELAEAETAGVRAHLGACAFCARELSWLKAERAALKARPDPAPRAVPLPRAALAAVRQRASRQRWRDRSAARRSLLVAGLAAAASLLIAVQDSGGAPAPAVEEAAELSSFIPWCGDAPDAARTLESAFS